MKPNNNQYVQDQTKIIELISSGIPLKQILQFIVTSMEKQYQSIQMYASILLYDPVHNILRNMISTSLPTNFMKSHEQVHIGPEEGSCGTAAYLKRPIIVSDIEKDPLWKKYLNRIKPFGLKACWSTPILSTKKELLGTFALYYKEIYEPNSEMINTFEQYNRLAAIAIEISEAMESEHLREQGIDKRNNNKLTNKRKENLLQQLHLALERHEFEIYYQPSFSLINNDLGAEALIRWNHPNSGLLPPVAFLEFAEKTGFIIELEKWVLTQSIKEVTNFQQKGLIDLGLSVNISAHQFENPNFSSMVSNVLNRFAFNPNNLTLEITERFLIKQENIAVLHQLKNIGVRISIDDFGTSYSSLQYLKDLPIDELKIDRSFIINMESNLNNQKIVEMIIMLGHQLDLAIVAEGVETEEQLKLLQQMNCDRVQGFLFTPPIPKSKFEQKYVHR